MKSEFIISKLPEDISTWRSYSYFVNDIISFRDYDITELYSSDYKTFAVTEKYFLIVGNDTNYLFHNNLDDVINIEHEFDVEFRMVETKMGLLFVINDIFYKINENHQLIEYYNNSSNDATLIYDGILFNDGKLITVYNLADEVQYEIRHNNAKTETYGEYLLVSNSKTKVYHKGKFLWKIEGDLNPFMDLAYTKDTVYSLTTGEDLFKTDREIVMMQEGMKGYLVFTRY